MESIVVMVEALIELCQVIAIVATSAIVWPPLMTGLMDAFAAFGFEISDLAAFECMINYDKDYKLYWPSSVVIPGLLLQAFAVHFLTQLFPDSFAKFRMYMPFTWNLCGKIINTLYVSQVALGMTPFVCYAHPEPNEHSSLVSYPGTICMEGDWAPIAIAGIISLILSAAYFAYMCFELWRLPQKMHDPNAKKYMQSITFLIEDFRADVYYWNVPMKLTEVVFAVVFVIGAGDALKERIFLTFIFLFSLFGMARFWPYKAPLINLIVSITYGVLVMVLLPAGTHESPEQEKFGEQAMFAFTIISVLSFAFVFVTGIANIIVEGKHGNLFAYVMLRKRLPNLNEIAQSWDQIRKIDEQAMLEYLSNAQIYDINAVENMIPILAPSLAPNHISASSSIVGSVPQSEDANNEEGKENAADEIEEPDVGKEDILNVAETDTQEHQAAGFVLNISDEVETESKSSCTI
jgi:hypothetical protein